MSEIARQNTPVGFNPSGRPAQTDAVSQTVAAHGYSSLRRRALRALGGTPCNLEVLSVRGAGRIETELPRMRSCDVPL